MGTRNLTLVVVDEEIKVAQYGQFDGYPEGQGVTALTFLRSLDADGLDLFEDIVRNRVTPLTQERRVQLWEDCGAEPGQDWISMDVSNIAKVRYPFLVRNLAAGILQYLYDNNGGECHLDTDFAKDSLFCEWAYLVDMDRRVLEVYKGFNQKPLDDHERFAKLFGNVPDDNGYYPISLVTTFDLDMLPTDEEFINTVVPPEEDEFDDPEEDEEEWNDHDDDAESED